MSYNPETWNGEPYRCERTRFCEYTDEMIKNEFNELTAEKLDRLMSFPTLFSIEGEKCASRIGYINRIRVRSTHLLIEYVFDPILPPIETGALVKLTNELDIGDWELNRTHWAIKDDDLIRTLLTSGYISKEQQEASSRLRAKKNPNFKKNDIDLLNNDHVFIVHGHDDAVKNDVSTFISSLGLKPIILHQQASKGKTIIEKIEEYTNVGFSVVLYTPCDVGEKYFPLLGQQPLNFRARQNVVFEHGYLMAKLGRERVTALVKNNTEAPNDINGVVYINYDEAGSWKNELLKEIQSAGITTNQ